MHTRGNVDSERVADETLVQQALAGDLSAFGQLVQRHERATRAICWAVLRDHHLASDAAQEAFVDAYRSLASLKTPSAFGGWVATIAQRRALRMAQRRPPERTLPDVLADETADDPELLAQVLQLPEQEREVILLRFFDGHDAAAIATLLQRPLGTVTKQLSRAYERLRSALREEMRP